jgi:hypothetical protein
MLAHRIETIIREDGTLTLENLPFHSGVSVEVIILAQIEKSTQQNPYSLRGTPIHFINPLEPVGQDDWEVTA